ncbi:MAG: metallophosphoesterase [Planctomycetota bacterium]|jgi:3',5'-cyclic AMP phosphodiesterase CpdA
MPRLAWISDVHLNFLDAPGRREFYAALAAAAPDAVLLGGDTAESPGLCHHLAEMAEALRRPVYFVLGNHDFYRGSIRQTRRLVAQLADQSPLLTYLSRQGVLEIGSRTALVGHDGWADGREGDFDCSEVILNDYLLIEELTKFDGLGELDRHALGSELAALGDEAAGHFAAVLPEALKTGRRVVALTHVPPFRQACWHQGRISDDDYLPHFSCRAVGQVLRETMQSHPESELLVLCGHTHGEGEAHILDNLRVLTAGAEYGQPAIQRVFEFE